MTRDPIRLGRLTLLLNAVVAFLAVGLLLWTVIEQRTTAHRAVEAAETQARLAQQAATRARVSEIAAENRTALLIADNERLLRFIERRLRKSDKLLLKVGRLLGADTRGLRAGGSTSSTRERPSRRSFPNPPPSGPPEPEPVICLPLGGICLTNQEG